MNKDPHLERALRENRVIREANREAKRLRALRLAADGLTNLDISRALGVSKDAVAKWRGAT